jgi:hypothetical protein
MLYKAICTAAIAMAVFMTSCSRDNPLVAIGGKVTFDGAPVADGDILFTPTDSAFGSESAKIVDGAYQANLRPGQTKVQIRASRPVPGKKGPMGEQLIEDYIPAKYNDQSSLVIDVSKGQRKHDFELQSK